MCGLIGIFGTPRAAFETYKGLFTLQHRGQDAAGILSYDFNKQKFKLLKDSGLVSEVFDEEGIQSLEGEMAIGHTRYSTVGRGERKDIQPQLLNYPLGLGMAHNGNLVNYYELVSQLKNSYQRHSLTNNDVEVILNLFAAKLAQYIEETSLTFEQLSKAFRQVEKMIVGGYAVVAEIAQVGMFGFRDPKGIRPLVIGKRKLTSDEKKQSSLKVQESVIFCSETNTLNYLGYEIVRDVEPGEIVFVDKSGEIFSQKLVSATRRHCMFEWVYFSSAESIIEGKSVYEARLQLGGVLSRQIQQLIENKEIQPDIVAPIPETSRLSTIAVAEELGIPYREILIKNRYIHRSFILDSGEKRSQAVDMKLNPVKHEVVGKNILLVDDSIVRGTTSRSIVKALKKYGAKEIYLASTCPEIKYPCYFGVDFPDRQKLLAVNRTHKEIERELGIEKVIYISQKDLQQALRTDQLCMACLNGDYPVVIDSATGFVKRRVQDRTS